MERVQSLVLAIVVAAVSFFAVRQLFDSGTDEHALAYGVPSAVVGADAARQRDVPRRRRAGGDAPPRDEQRPPRRADPPGRSPPAQQRSRQRRQRWQRRGRGGGHDRQRGAQAR